MRDYASGSDHRWFRFENASMARAAPFARWWVPVSTLALEPGMDSNRKIIDLQAGSSSVAAKFFISTL
jgi:hypothetical protein